jgi:hypothetical protein
LVEGVLRDVGIKDAVVLRGVGWLAVVLLLGVVLEHWFGQG